MPEAAEIVAKKDELRARLRAEREALSAETVRAASEAVCAHVLGVREVAAARRVALYAAVRGEIDPAQLAGALAGRGVVVAWPRIDGRDLRFFVSEVDALAPGKFGIPAPPPGAAELPLDSVEVVLVPGVAFDRRGHRLGFGRGYYDAALEAAPRALRVGLCHDFQLVDALPRLPSDQPVDLIVTPDGARATAARPEHAPSEVPT